MEANKEMPSEMQSKGKSLVLDSNLSKEHIPHNITKDMPNLKASGTFWDMIKSSEECLLSMPLWTSSTSSQNHQESAKESSEPQRASDKTSEVSGLIVLTCKIMHI